MDDFIEKEKALFEIIDKLETDIMKFVEPRNSLTQKAKFFKALKKGLTYEPIFSYLPRNHIFAYFALEPEYNSLLKNLQELKFGNSEFEKLLKKKKSETLKSVELIRAIGTRSFPDKSKDYYGKPNIKLVKIAFEILEEKQTVGEKKKYSSEKVAEYLQRELDKRNIDWQIYLEENMSANAITLPAEKSVKINANATYGLREMERLLVHEIETHVYRHINASAQPYRVLLEGASPEWLQTEEGLAVINEVVFGKCSQETVRKYAGRVLAIHFAMKHSFFETFKQLNDFFPAEQAYQLTQRAKRGCITSEPGAFTKDYYYLQGAILVKEFVEEGNSLKELYYGKVALSELETVKKAPILKKPKYVPNYKKADWQALEKLPF